jgi:hypothetical protein
VHNPNVSLRNRFLLNSSQVQLSTALLAIGTYVAVIFSATKTGFLSRVLVAHFDVATVEKAYNDNVVTLAVKTFVAGIAAKEFLFNPSIGAPATLPETFKQNFWYFSRQTRTLIKQTTFLSAFILANTVQRCSTLKGSDLVGSVSYALLWIVATAITSAWLLWVSDTSN